MSHRRSSRFVVIGAGASGALMAAHLLRADAGGATVTIIEKRDDLGRGLAYGTRNPSHLLNVRAGNMSAFPEEQDHFWRWLIAQGLAEDNEDRFRFVPRGVYGDYLESLLQDHLGVREGVSPLVVVRDRAREIAATKSGVEVALEVGGSVSADIAILACGHEYLADEGPLFLNPWTEPIGGDAPIDSTLLILGTGLTMVDAATALQDRGHRGRIVAVSRRGLLPQPHRDVAALAIDPAEAPFDRDLATIANWLRTLARNTERQGGDWRSVIDGLRPHTQTIWRMMSPHMRQRFLRHARPWWDTHRHRMAPEIAARLKGLTDSGRLEVIAGSLAGVAPSGDGARVGIRRRGGVRVETLDVSRIISCKGVTSNPPKNRNPLVASLLASGLARVDPLDIGLDVDDDCALIDCQGRPSRRLFAIGPMSQAAFWEITAVPDIRLQAEQLAQRLALAAYATRPSSAGAEFAVG